jgi:hypothetical protein
MTTVLIYNTIFTKSLQCRGGLVKQCVLYLYYEPVEISNERPTSGM